MTDPAEHLRARLAAVDWTQPPKLLDPLPWRTRLRLWKDHQVNSAGCWLVNHGHTKAAIRFWRLWGGW